MFGINDAGWAVGRSGSAATARAVLWTAGTSLPSTSPPAMLLLSLLIGGVAVAGRGLRGRSIACAPTPGLDPS